MNKNRGCFLCGALNEHKRISKHPLAARKRMRIDGVTETPYESFERRIIGKEIVNVEYHRTDWAKCFRGVL